MTGKWRTRPGIRPWIHPHSVSESFHHSSRYQCKRGITGGRFTVRSGSCISTAITAGAVALTLEWELEQKNITGIDVFQIKSLLILGAIRPDFLEYPNREWGYGQLNLYNTFEAMRQL